MACIGRLKKKPQKILHFHLNVSCKIHYRSGVNQEDQNLYRVSGAGLGTTPQQLNKDFGGFSASKAFEIGWQVYKDNFWLAAGVSFVWYIIYVMASQSCFGIIAVPHLIASGTFFGLSMVRKAPRFESIFDGFNQFGKVFAAGALLFAILFGLILLIGIPTIILFATGILPNPDDVAAGSEDVAGFLFLGIMFVFGLIVSLFYYYVLARWHLVFPLIVERDYPVMDAIRTSWDVTKNHQWSLFGLKFLSLQVLPFLGILLCCVGFPFLTGLGFAYEGAAAALYLGTETPEKQTPGSAVQNPQNQTNTDSASAQPSQENKNPYSTDRFGDSGSGRFPETGPQGSGRDSGQNPYS